MKQRVLKILLKIIELDMAYKVVITKEVDEALDCIDEYCIEHFHNYEFAKKVFNEIIKVASFFLKMLAKLRNIQNFYINMFHLI